MEWITLSEVNFDDTIEELHCDTRDFGCMVKYEKCGPKYLLRKGRIFTMEEVKAILFKLKEETGGDVEWRMLTFVNDHTDTTGWNWKYIRVYKVDNGYGIANSHLDNNTFVTRTFFDRYKVNHKYLNAH